ncbi:MAG: MFS transporter [Desulfobacterales bacterium]|nr:MFS transporter [Desulfobacterales bacterium]
MNIRQSFFSRAHGVNHHWWALGAISIGSFAATYDTGALNISLPQIMVSFQASFKLIIWVPLAFLLTSTAFLLPAGQLGDIIGRKKIYNIGLIIFLAGSALCVLSQSPTQLILFRVFQSLGASMIYTNFFAIITAVFPEKNRGQGLGFGMALAVIGVSSGPAIGGLITSYVGWRGIFVLNVAAAISGLISSHLILQEKLVSPPSGESSRHFDVVGTGLVAAAIVSLFVGLNFGQEKGWDAVATHILFAIAALTMIAFPWYESRRTHPVVDITLFKNRIVSFNMIARLICFFALAANGLLMPFFLQLVRGYSPAEAGLTIAAMSIIIAIVSPVTGSLANHISSRTLSTAGMALMSLSLYFLSRLNLSSTYGDVLWRLLLLGLGHAIFQTPNSTSIMDSVPKDKFGVISGVLALIRQTGQALGIGVANTIVVASLSSKVGNVSLYSIKRDATLLEQGDAISAFAAGIDQAFLAASLICILGVIFCLIRGKTARDQGIHAR